MSTSSSTPLLTDPLVRLGAAPVDKETAIREAGRLLVAAGCVAPQYVESMLRREKLAETFLGSGVAIPHGMLEDKSMIFQDGVAVLQVSQGMEWNSGQTVRLVVGIAAASDSHIAVLRRLTSLLHDEARLKTLFETNDPSVVKAALLEEGVQAPPSGPTTDLPEKIEWVLDYPAGLHARPASVWVNAAKDAGVPLRIRCRNNSADPRRLVSLLQLGAKTGEVLTISAEGPKAAEALAAFRTVVAGLSAEEKAAAARVKVEPQSGWLPPEETLSIQGVAASPGLAVGVVCRLDAPKIVISDVPASLEQGGALLEKALNQTRRQMKELIDDAAHRLGSADAAVFSAQAAFLDDSDLITRTCRHIVAGHGVAWSLNAAIEAMAESLAANENAVLAARSADLRDVGRRILRHLDPSAVESASINLPEGGLVLVAGDLSPSETAGLDSSKVFGLATAFGAPGSHTAILARTLGIAAVVAAGDGLFAAENGDVVIVDGDAGRVWLKPTKKVLESAEQWIARLDRKRAVEAGQRDLPAQTADGRRIGVAANINRPDQAPAALEHGADGVGLMRTEFLFLEHNRTPSEDEQYATYREMLEALGGRPLTVRALDVGGDKRAAHLCLPREENPFLGVRGSRLLLRRPDLFEPQMRALYRVARDGGKLSVMFPMITSVKEIVELRDRCEKIRRHLDAPAIPLGIMIEVPAAAVLADCLARHADFFSIGTNDLTQYALAMDRQNPALAVEADSFHPAVLGLIRQTVNGASRCKRRVGVCGGLAGDPFGAALLVGIGVQDLSAPPRDIPAVKALLRRHSGEALESLAQRALLLEHAGDVCALVREELGTGDDLVQTEENVA